MNYKQKNNKCEVNKCKCENYIKIDVMNRVNLIIYF